MMKETLKTITLEQRAILEKYTPDLIEQFFQKLNNNYGDGEILTFPQIESFVKHILYQENGLDYLNEYIDCIRMLRLLNRDTNEIVGVAFNELIEFHNDLIEQLEGKECIDEQIAKLFLEATKPFKYLNQENEILRVELIETLEELNTEGSFMNHCIASYYNYVAVDKQYIAFRVFNLINKERLTLGCLRQGDELLFNQLKGNSNMPATGQSCAFVIKFLHQNNIQIPYESNDLAPAFRATLQ